MSVTIRTIRGEDFYPALALWNETRRHDPITARFFKRKIFLDVCFDPAGYILAECDGRLCGYIYVVRRLRALDNDNAPLPTDGWINGYSFLNVFICFMIVGSLVSLLLFGRHGGMVYEWIGTAIFSLFIGYDWARANTCAKTVKNAIDLSASLYLDIVNLFLRLLRMMSRNRK